MAEWDPSIQTIKFFKGIKKKIFYLIYYNPK